MSDDDGGATTMDDLFVNVVPVVIATAIGAACSVSACKDCFSDKRTFGKLGRQLPAVHRGWSWCAQSARVSVCENDSGYFVISLNCFRSFLFVLTVIS